MPPYPQGFPVPHYLDFDLRRRVQRRGSQRESERNASELHCLAFLIIRGFEAAAAGGVRGVNIDHAKLPAGHFGVGGHHVKR